MAPYSPHDLLRLGDLTTILDGTEPTWVAAALTAVPWVVVCRTTARPGHIPVGVRGSTRSLRHAAQLPETAVIEAVRPEDLCEAAQRHRSALPVAVALRQAAPVLDAYGLPWGPTGSLGFEVATGEHVTTLESDLDILVRVRGLPSPRWATQLRKRLTGLPAPLDCQIQTASGAVALAELAHAHGLIALRTAYGPRLIRLAGAAA